MLFKKKARILIDLAKSRVLDALGMPFWLSSGTCLGKILWICNILLETPSYSYRCYVLDIVSMYYWHWAPVYKNKPFLPLLTPLSVDRRSVSLPVLQVGFVSVTSYLIARTSTLGCSLSTTTFAWLLRCRWTIYRSNICSERYVRRRTGSLCSTVTVLIGHLSYGTK